MASDFFGDAVVSSLSRRHHPGYPHYAARLSCDLTDANGVSEFMTDSRFKKSILGLQASKNPRKDTAVACRSSILTAAFG